MKPTIDVHCHMGGSYPVEFVHKIAQQQRLVIDISDTRQQMVYGEFEYRDFYRFLGKFKLLDKIQWTEELVDESIKAICDNIVTAGLDYVWMDFSVNKFIPSMGWNRKEAIAFVCDAYRRHGGKRVGLILSLKYESQPGAQIQMAKVVENPNIVDGLIGIDLVGDEKKFDCDFYQSIFRDWNKAGKITRTHTGESQSLQNVIDSINKLNVTNIAHGFKILEDEDAVKLAKDKQVTFDLAITSNYLTGVVPEYRRDTMFHPIIDMVRKGLRVTIGSDDPVVCNTTLEAEFKLAKKLGLTNDELVELQVVAAQNSRRFR